MKKSPNMEATLILNFAYTAQKMKFCIKDFFSKCEQIRKIFKVCQTVLGRYALKG